MGESILIQKAAEYIQNAEALLITAGAGIGVDSGLPDFRGNTGFWNAYPPIADRGLSFSDMANPAWFQRDSALAWAFYGHRLNLYRETTPHKGFELMKGWGERKKHGYFVFTSNVDGQFQKAGYDEGRINECHGSIHHLQCTRPCSSDIWSADSTNIEVDMELFEASSPMPVCPKCGSLARPNILMFGDWGWNSRRTDDQESRFGEWLRSIPEGKLVVIENGAGSAVPTVRMTSQRLAANNNGKLIRINVREPDVHSGHLGIAAPSLETLQKIDRLIQ